MTEVSGVAASKTAAAKTIEPTSAAANKSSTAEQIQKIICGKDELDRVDGKKTPVKKYAEIMASVKDADGKVSRKGLMKLLGIKDDFLGAGRDGISESAYQHFFGTTGPCSEEQLLEGLTKLDSYSKHTGLKVDIILRADFVAASVFLRDAYKQKPWEHADDLTKKFRDGFQSIDYVHDNISLAADLGDDKNSKIKDEARDNARLFLLYYEMNNPQDEKYNKYMGKVARFKGTSVSSNLLERFSRLYDNGMKKGQFDPKEWEEFWADVKKDPGFRGKSSKDSVPVKT